MNKKRVIKLAILGGILTLGILLYRPFIEYLVTQAANPSGFIGSAMTKKWAGYFENQTQWGFALIDSEEYDTILSVGYGSGSGIKYMKDNSSATVYGVDISEEAFNTASKINKEKIDAGGVILSVGDVAYLSYEDDFFDLIVAGQTHIYWEDLEKGLLECHRTLQGGGTLLITCEIDKIEYHIPDYSDTEKFVELLISLGFTDISVEIDGNHIAFICTK